MGSLHRATTTSLSGGLPTTCCKLLHSLIRELAQSGKYFALWPLIKQEAQATQSRSAGEITWLDHLIFSRQHRLPIPIPSRPIDVGRGLHLHFNPAILTPPAGSCGHNVGRYIQKRPMFNARAQDRFQSVHTGQQSACAMRQRVLQLHPIKDQLARQCPTASLSPQQCVHSGRTGCSSKRDATFLHIDTVCVNVLRGTLRQLERIQWKRW